MTDTATRNRQIKATLAKAFSGRKITVRGSRGTAYGYVHVFIDWTPLDREQTHKMEALCFGLLHAAKIDLGKRFTDDTCQDTCSEVSIRFNPAHFYLTMKHDDGSMSVVREFDGSWERI